MQTLRQKQERAQTWQNDEDEERRRGKLEMASQTKLDALRTIQTGFPFMELKRVSFSLLQGKYFADKRQRLYL